MRVFTAPNTPMPEVQLLSNGRYHVMVTNAGGGYSRWKDLAVTRWREDGTCDNWGTFCYIRDVDQRRVLVDRPSADAQAGRHYEAIFSEARAEFRRRDHDYRDAYRDRRLARRRHRDAPRHASPTARARRRTIEVTSYAEVVLAPPAADALHPAFSNLFVQTEILPDAAGDPVHAPAALARRAGAVDVAPDGGARRGRRGSFVRDRPPALHRPRPHRGRSAGDARSRRRSRAAQGSVLDPIVAIRYRITLEPDQSATSIMVTGIAETREAALGLVEKYQDRHLADRVFDLAWTHSQVVLRQINATEADAQLYGRLAGSVIYANPSLRAEASVLASNRRGQSGLWGYAISGDLPIVLLRIGDLANIELVRQLVQAHAYWRLKGWPSTW